MCTLTFGVLNKYINSLLLLYNCRLGIRYTVLSATKYMLSMYYMASDSPCRGSRPGIKLDVTPIWSDVYIGPNRKSDLMGLT